jgi:hypothetical protein
MLTINALIEALKQRPDTVEFTDVIEHIDRHYRYTPGRFSNGCGGDALINEAGTNEGSCKIFAFAKLHGFEVPQTLACFGRYYREDVLGNPRGTDHANIRRFMRDGWRGIHFEQPVLERR